MREQSFMKGLFLGAIEESLVFSWPAPNAQEVDLVRTRLDGVRRFFDREVDSARIDREEHIPDSVLRGLSDLGLFGMLVPQRQGGMGLTNTAYARVIEEVAGLDPSVAATMVAHESLAMKALLLFGSPALKDRYLPRLASGELLAAFALAEPGTGSDAAAIQTRATPRADGFELSGAKGWTTNGGLAGLFTVFARSSPSEEGVKPKITAFLVERGWGVKSGPNEAKLGIRGSSTTSLSFDEVFVPATHVLGDLGGGLGVAMQVLDSSRLALASGCVGMCKTLLRLAVDHCRRRQAFGRTIGEFGLVKDKVASILSETWALESATYLTTGRVDAGARDFSVESAICKVLGSETCWRAAGEAMQVAGGVGLMASHPYERWLRDARANLVFEGNNETLRAFIALTGMHGAVRERSHVARALREPMQGLGRLTDFALRRARGALGRERTTRHHAVLKREAAVLETYAQELSRGTDKVLRKHGRDIAEMQYTQKRTADLAIDLYAVAACVARTTHAIERRGEEGARREIDLTSIYVAAAEKRMAQIVGEVDKNDDELRKSIAGKTYDDGGYPFDAM